MVLSVIFRCEVEDQPGGGHGSLRGERRADDAADVWVAE